MRFQCETSVFTILRRSVDEKHLMRFQSKASVFKTRSVDGAKSDVNMFPFQMIQLDSILQGIVSGFL